MCLPFRQRERRRIEVEGEDERSGEVDSVL